jgi:hypothetical protein
VTWILYHSGIALLATGLMITPKHSKKRITIKGKTSLVVVAKAKKVKSRRSGRSGGGRGRKARGTSGGSSSTARRMFEIAYPREGLPQMMGLESRVPVIPEVLYDTTVMTTDSNGFCNLVILPDFVGTATTAPINGGATSQTVSFFNTGPTISAGSAPSWTNANTPSFSFTQYDNTLTTMMTSTNTGTSPFLRVRLLSVSVEYQFVGDTLYDGGIIIVQGFESRDSSSSLGVAIPSSSSIITPLYHMGPLRQGFVLSMPFADRASSELYLAPSNNFLDGNNGSAVFGGLSIWLSSPHASTTLGRVTVRRMANFQLATSPAASLFSQMAQKAGPPLPDEQAKLEAYEAADSTGITIVPPGVDPYQAVADRYGLDIDVADVRSRAKKHLSSAAGRLVKHALNRGFEAAARLF